MYRGPKRLRLHRPIDILVSSLGLIAAAPLLLIGWIAARASSRGPGFFRQARIGRDGAPFDIVKLRSMNASSIGSSITTADDQRITRVGKILRQSKLDEVPQLLNVLRGDMALIGPRPDVPGFADLLEGPERQLLSVRPGISGPASVLFGSEEDLLASVEDPETFNSALLFPAKTTINLAWLNEGTLLTDLRLALLTLKSPAPDEARGHLAKLLPHLDLDAACPELAARGWTW